MLRADPARQTAPTASPGCSRTARSNGSRSACCSCRSRSCCCSTSRSPGMSDEETERTAELFVSLAGKHSLVVVEHDMAFVGKIARKVTVLHEGSVLAEGPLDTGAERSARDRSLSGALSVASLAECSRSPTSTSTTAAATSCATCRFEAPAGKVTALLGRNGVGKTTLLQDADGPGAGEQRRGHVRGTRTSPPCKPYERARAGIGYVPQGREIFPRLTVEENLQMGLATRPRGAQHSGADLRDVPGAEADAAPARRRPLRRPAAAARDRPRARDRARAADPRRAHRRHPAFDHQGHRARDPHARRERRDGDPAGRAVLRLRALARRPVPGHGARRDRRARAGADMDRDGVRRLLAV